MNIDKTFYVIGRVFLLFVLLYLEGCAKKSFILTGHSHVSHQAAVQQVQSALHHAEQQGCTAVSMGAGTGTGIVIPDDCANCDMKDKQNTYDLYVLVRCPSQVEDSPAVPNTPSGK